MEQIKSIQQYTIKCHLNEKVCGALMAKDAAWEAASSDYTWEELSGRFDTWPSAFFRMWL